MPTEKRTGLTPACGNSAACSAVRHHFDECQERVSSGNGYEHEDCTEELYVHQRERHRTNTDQLYVPTTQSTNRQFTLRTARWSARPRTYTGLLTFSKLFSKLA